MSQFNAPVRRSGGDIDVYTGMLVVAFLVLAGGIFLLAKKNIDHSATGPAKGGVVTLVSAR